MSLANIGPPELIIVLVIVLVLFGSSQLPKLARSLGQAQKEFKTGIAEGSKDDGGSAGSKTPEPDTTEQKQE